MGILKTLTEEYFGEIEREEDLIDIHDLNVEIVSFTDNNDKFHKRGYKPKDKDILKELLLHLWFIFVFYRTIRKHICCVLSL